MEEEARLAPKFIAIGSVLDATPAEVRLRLKAIVNVDGTLSSLVPEVRPALGRALTCGGAKRNPRRGRFCAPSVP